MNHVLHAVEGPAAFKRADAGSYDSVATTFDQLTDQYSAPLADQVVRLGRLAPGQRVLDIGTGTGVVASRAARMIAPSGRVCGIDLSSGMLRVFQEKSRASQFGDRMTGYRMDAEALAFAPGVFDTVLSLFALMHFPDPLAALRQMYSVMRPRGRIVVAVGSGPPISSVAGWLHRLARLPELAAAARGSYLVAPGFLNTLVDRYLPTTLSEPEESSLARSHHHPARAVPALLRQASFTHVASSWLGHTAHVASAEAFWTLQATFSTIARKRLARATAADRERVRSEFFQRCAQVQRRGGRLLFPQAALFVTAQRPA